MSFIPRNKVPHTKVWQIRKYGVAKSRIGDNSVFGYRYKFKTGKKHAYWENLDIFHRFFLEISWPLIIKKPFLASEWCEICRTAVKTKIGQVLLINKLFTQWYSTVCVRQRWCRSPFYCKIGMFTIYQNKKMSSKNSMWYA